MDGQVHRGAVVQVDAHVARGHAADQGGVSVEHGQVPLAGPQHQGHRRAGPQGPLGGQHLEGEGVGHQLASFSMFRAFSSTVSTPPTFKKACSGTVSRSPLTRASNDSTVSSIGV